MLHHLIPGRNGSIVDSKFVVSVYQPSLVAFDASILTFRMIVRWIEKPVLLEGLENRDFISTFLLRTSDIISTTSWTFPSISLACT